MPARLVALTGEADIKVDRSLVLVGRHPRCDARLTSSRVSRRHCCLIEVDGEVLVRDLGSINGVFINGRRRESGRLRPGDVLSIAHVRFRLEECLSARAISAVAPTGSSPDGRSLAGHSIAVTGEQEPH
jgi:pSer/pThr/pTyr-binding forkhead associated (FHA) protein